MLPPEWCVDLDDRTKISTTAQDAGYARGHRLLAAAATCHSVRGPDGASELVPSASSVALSVRELVRQGYLLSAQILARPLWERVATLSYLIEHPEAIRLWRNGWPHKSRPHLQTRMEVMHDGGVSSERAAQVRQIINEFNSLVHGDPAAANAVAILLDNNRVGYTIGRDLGSPARVDTICFTSAMLLVVLLGRCEQLFPAATAP